MNLQKENKVDNKKYRDWVKTLPCSITGVQPAGDCHHITGKGQGGIGIKPCDLLTMPLTREQHTLMHNDPDMWAEQWEYVAKTLHEAVKQGVLDFTKVYPK